MTVRDLLSMEIDIDCYDDVCEELAIAFCGPMILTEEGVKTFDEVLDYAVELHEDYAVVHISDEDDAAQEERLQKAKKFFYALAGYCADTDYKRWFKED